MKNSVRKLKDMERVIMTPELARQHPERELYFVHRAVKEDGNLRYDVTVLKPDLLGQEHARTKGNVNTNGFQELYTVLEGQAVFVLQKFKDRKVNDVYAAKMKVGDWIIIPPYYWVIMINLSTEDTLETGNWVSRKTNNVYQTLEEMGGMCYFYTTEGWVKNNNYEKVPELRFEEPMKDRPESLDFLRTGIEN